MHLHAVVLNEAVDTSSWWGS